MFAWPARTVIRNASTASTFAYVFDYPVNTRSMVNFPICEGVSCHGYEMALEFQTMWDNFTTSEQTGATAIATYWSNFAKSQNPNSPVAVPVTWAQIAPGAENYLHINTTITTASNYLQSDCNMWDGIRYNGNWLGG